MSIQDAKIPFTMTATKHDHGHQEVPSDLALRVKALESLLVEKGLVDPAALDALIDTYEQKVGPRNGARVVARAWVDPAYQERLLTDATAAIGELGYTGGQGEHMIVVANGPKVHNLVVCTLCSCYPWPVRITMIIGLRLSSTWLRLGAWLIRRPCLPARRPGRMPTGAHLTACQ